MELEVEKKFAIRLSQEEIKHLIKIADKRGECGLKFSLEIKSEAGHHFVDKTGLIVIVLHIREAQTLYDAIYRYYHTHDMSDPIDFKTENLANLINGEL